MKSALLAALRRIGEDLAALGETINTIAIAVASEGDTLEDDEVVRMLDGADIPMIITEDTGHAD